MPLDKILVNYKEFLTNSSEFALVEYDILNENDRTSDTINAHLSSIDFGLLSDKDGIRPIDANTKTTNFSLHPKGEAKLWLIMDYAPYISREKSLINGFSIPIIDKNRSSGYFAESIYKSAPAIIMILAVIGFAFTAASVIVTIPAIASGSTPKLLTGFYNNTEIARIIALVNYIREEDEERYGLIVRKSERLFTRWKNISKDK